MKFDCKICDRELKDARILPCGHSLCAICISQTIITSKMCPLCEFDLSLSTISSLPPNYAIQTWQKELPNYFSSINEEENQISSKREKKICINCDEREGLKYCENCKILLCLECSDSIHSLKAFQSHSFKKNSNQIHLNSKFAKCDQHKKKKEFYCEKCDEILCSVCLVENHNLHTSMSVYKFIENFKYQMKNSIEKSISRLPNLNYVEDNYQTRIILIDEEIIRLEEKIKKLKEKKENTQRKLVANRAAETIVDSTNLFLFKFLEEINFSDFRSRSYYQKLGRLFHENIDKIYCTILPQFRKYYEKNTKKVITTGFNDKENLSKAMISSHGSRGIVTSRFYDPYFVSLNYEANMLAVSDYKNRRIQIFNLNGEYLHQFGTKGVGDNQFNGPMGLAICPKLKQIVVCDHKNHRIQFFDFYGNFLFKFGEMGVENGQFLFPTGIAISKRANMIAVVDYGNRRVQFFNLHGKFKFQITKNSINNNNNHNNTHNSTHNNNNNVNNDDECQFNPIDVDISYKGNLIAISDFASHQIKFFDLQGKFKYQFGKYGTGEGEFNCPGGLAISMKANLLVVADEFNHRISMYDLNSGAFRNHYSVTTGDGEKSIYHSMNQFRYPRGIDISSKANLIAVADRGNNRFILIKSIDYLPPKS